MFIAYVGFTFVNFLERLIIMLNKNILFICAIFLIGGLFAEGDAYPLSHCIVTGKDISHIKRPISYNYKGNDFKFFNMKALKKFKRSVRKYMHKMNEQIIKQQLAHYPMNKCVVSGELLDNHSINIVHKNRLVRLCCKGCVKDFKKKAKSYITELDNIVIHHQKPHYSLTHCVVMDDEALGGAMGEPIDFVHANHLIRFCCDGCIKKFRRNPSKFMKKIQHNHQNKEKHHKQNGHNHNHKHDH